MEGNPYFSTTHSKAVALSEFHPSKGTDIQEWAQNFVGGLKTPLNQTLSELLILLWVPESDQEPLEVGVFEKALTFLYMFVENNKRNSGLNCSILFPGLFQINEESLNGAECLYLLSPPEEKDSRIREHLKQLKELETVQVVEIQTSKDKVVSFESHGREVQNSLFKVKGKANGVLGGTFDGLHMGHKILLSSLLLISPKNITIGVAVDELLKNKKNKWVIQNYATRREEVIRFCKMFNKETEIESFPLKDMYGSTVEVDYDSLVVSAESIKGGDLINEARVKSGKKPLDVYCCHLLGNPGENKQSSTAFREKLTLQITEPQFLLLQEKFRSLSERLGISSVYGDLWFSRLLNHFCEEWRFYHGPFHILKLYDDLGEFQRSGGFKEATMTPKETTMGQANPKVNWDLIEVLIWFHDAIYVPWFKNNEEKSAELFREFNRGNEIKEGELVEKVILATKDHSRNWGDLEKIEEFQVFLDMDLGIISTELPVYQEYAEKVRKEYEPWIGPKTFIEKRPEFLKGMRDKPIYRTELFKRERENKAKENIQWEIDTLGSFPKL